MTDKGKEEYYGSLSMCEDFDPTAFDKEKEEEYSSLIKALSDDDAFKNSLGSLVGVEDKSPKFADFKKKLVYLLTKTKLALIDVHKEHKRSSTTQIKIEVKSMQQSMEKFILSEKYKDCLRKIIKEQLIKQKTCSGTFDDPCYERDIVDFIDNLSPLMKLAANNAHEEMQHTRGRNTKKLDVKENPLKQELANKLAVGFHFLLKIRVSGTHETDEPTIFDEFFVICCEKAGFGKIRHKSDQVKNAAAHIRKIITEQDSKNKT